MEQTQIGEALVVNFVRLDSNNAPQVGDQLQTLLAGGLRHLVIDLGKTEYISSAGLRAVLIAGKAANKHGARFALARLEGPIHQIFSLSGFLTLFPIYPDVDSALAAAA